MSRHKNAVKRRPDLPPHEQQDVAHYGQQYNPNTGELKDQEAMDAVFALGMAITSIAKVDDPELAASFMERTEVEKFQSLFEYMVKFSNFVARNYGKSFGWLYGSKGSEPSLANCFQRLADAVKAFEGTGDPYAHFLGLLYCDRCFHRPASTVEEMQRRMKEQGFPVSKKTVGRMYQCSGANPAEGKRGPKPGTKQRLVHRALRN